MSISSIKKALRNVFQGKLKNIVSLADDSPIDNHLKPLKIGNKTTNIELSEDEVCYKGKELVSGDIEGTAIKSTSETGGSKFLREDGDGTCSWQTAGGGTQCWTFTLGGYMLNNNSSTNYYTSFYTNYFYWLNSDSSPTSISYTDAYTYNYKAPKAGVLTKICVTARATRTDPFKIYVYKAAPATGDTSTSATLIGTSDTITPPATNQLVVVDTTISSSNTFSAGDALYVWLKKDSTSGTQSIYFTITIQGDYS